MTKILVLGNETDATNTATAELAAVDGVDNCGLLSNISTDILDGYYHTSTADLVPGDIVAVASKFDLVIMLDQPQASYPHFKSFLMTLKVMIDLDANGINVQYRNNQHTQNTLQWVEFLKTNKSFCFHPFLALISDTDSTHICPKNLNPIIRLDELNDWQTDVEYNKIRTSMANGELIPDRCSDCYNREAEGQESTRQFETLEWAERLELKTVDDFFNVKSPAYYEIRPSNLCNIMCRTCDDGHSHLIEREWKTIDIPLVDWKFTNNTFDKMDVSSAKRVYWGGGEPTIMPEFYEFLEKCIADGNTSFDLEVGTNGMKFSDKLLTLLDQFTSAYFAFSFDGYKEINDYIRWKSKFDTVVKNAHMILDRGHGISVQSVFSIYSITRMHEVFEFWDSEFPKAGALVQVANGLEQMVMPFNHPCPELVVESMKRCQQTKVYYMLGRSVKSQVDLMVDYYSNPSYNVNIDLLTKFYKFNDKLDQARNSRLIDYIPELANARTIYGI
jgi:pyruvate-formate lyase-activating enzyme